MKFQSPMALIAASFKGEHIDLPCEPAHGQCAVTGIKGQCIPRKHLIGKSFTNLDILLAPDSVMVGVDTYQVLKYKWQRMSCWLCDGHEFKRLQRVDFRGLILQGVSAGQWCGHITRSYKKHGALKAKINNCKHGFWVFDEKLIDARDQSVVNNWYNKLDKMLRLGVGRNVLLSLEIPAYLLNKIGVKAWQDFYFWAQPIYQSGLYELIVYILPSMEELKKEAKNESESSKNNVSHGRQRSLFESI